MALAIQVQQVRWTRGLVASSSSPVRRNEHSSTAVRSTLVAPGRLNWHRSEARCSGPGGYQSQRLDCMPSARASVRQRPRCSAGRAALDGRRRCRQCFPLCAGDKATFNARLWPVVRAFQMLSLLYHRLDTHIRLQASDPPVGPSPQAWPPPAPQPPAPAPRYHRQSVLKGALRNSATPVSLTACTLPVQQAAAVGSMRSAPEDAKSVDDLRSYPFVQCSLPPGRRID